jgi:hypothetical protein
MCEQRIFATTGEQQRALFVWNLGRPSPVGRPAMAKQQKFPCRRTLKAWCNQGFESWLACQNGTLGTGQSSWTLKKSKFSHRQVLEWFSFKDELFKNRSTSSDLSDDTGKVQGQHW